jgi:hypothetical protein
VSPKTAPIVLFSVNVAVFVTDGIQKCRGSAVLSGVSAVLIAGSGLVSAHSITGWCE